MFFEKLIWKMVYFIGPAHSMEEVWIKNEPIDVEPTAYCHIKCEEEISIIDSEPSASFSPSDTASIKSEILLADYPDISPLHGIAVQSTTTKKRNYRVHSTEKNVSSEECGWKSARKNSLTGMWQSVVKFC